MDIEYRYEICIPLIGQQGQYFVVCSAQSPDSAAEVVRIILAQRDPRVSEVTVRVVPR
jgi:hypothetical protein